MTTSTTMNEFKSLKGLSVKITSGWYTGVSCNAPVRAFEAQIIYTTKAGARKVFGKATSRDKEKSIELAYIAALEFFNS